MNLYPLKFEPRYVEKLWGGRKLQTVLGKGIPPGKPIGESWELFDFPPGVIDRSGDWVSSRIANGPLAGRTLHWAVGEFGADLYGSAKLAGGHGQFPLLIKFLDAREDLSVQVHPDPEYARDHPHAHLKSEAWYVLQRDPGSRLLNGVRPGVTRESFRAALRDGSVERLIASVEASPGDCFYLPSGTVHALGAGILVAEVQTPSDTTFRVFDFNRVDPSTGRLRELHVEEALDCIDFESAGGGDTGPDEPNARLVTCPYFHIERRQSSVPLPIKDGEPTVVIVTLGSLRITSKGNVQTDVKMGETVLLPAAAGPLEIRLDGPAEWLEVTIPTATSSIFH